MDERLLEVVARMTGSAASAIRVHERPPLEHQSNRLYEARADGKHLIAKGIDLYRAIYPTFWLSVLFQEGLRRAQEGRLAGWTIDGLPANHRLRRYLARAIAWPDPEFSGEFDGLTGLELFPPS